MSTSTEPAQLPMPEPSLSVSKFYALNDDMDAVQAVLRRVFFEFLRTGQTLTEPEIAMLHSVANLVAELGTEKRNIAA
ncbi:hypothetical protein [Hymenobacter negativus]|uniref:MarR family transcriptional regulator n=1 Tax=Hymenobacter negativus TaxID=2795026 RepID=A0ABS3QA33_9BACT|nr:hypothetical protein [Hymenobacter negativus]MBO2007878.1 hypothetical protein [Hymenobacter negativus]